MKKIFVLILTLLLLFTVGMSSFASSTSLPVKQGSDVTGVNITKDGVVYQVHVKPKRVDKDQKTKLQETVASTYGNNEEWYAKVVKILVYIDDVSVEDDIVFENNYIVAFIMNSNKKVITVYFWDEANEVWDKATNIKQNGKRVSAVFEGICPVTFNIYRTEFGSGYFSFTPDDILIWSFTILMLGGIMVFALWSPVKKVILFIKSRR